MNTTDWVISQDKTTLTNENVIVSASYKGNTSNVLYSYNKLIWSEYPANGIEMSNNGSIYFKNEDGEIFEHVVSNIDKVAPDKPIISTSIIIAEEDISIGDIIISKGTIYAEIIIEPNSDAEKIKFYNKTSGGWEEILGYTSGQRTFILIPENGEIQLKAFDSCGNESQVTKHVIDYLDPTSDNPFADYKFISSKFSTKTTGKIQDGVELEYSDNAFKFVSEADKQGALTEDAVIVVTDSKVNGNPYKGCERVYSNVSLPTIKSTDKSYNYKSSVVAKNTLEISKDTGSTEFHRFANVNISKAEANLFTSGKTTKTIATSNTSSKTSDTETAKITSSESAAGKFTAEESTVNAVSNYATVNLDDSDIDSIVATNRTESDSRKVVINQTKEQRTLSASTKTQATGKVTLKNESNVDTITGYANVTLTDESTVNNVTNSSFSSSKSDSTTYDLSKQTITRKLSFTTTTSTSGTFTAKDSNVNGNVKGFATVSLTEVEGDGNFLRDTYSTIKETVTVTTDKAGIVTETYQKEEKFNRAGKLTANNSNIGNIKNFNNITLTGTVAGNISNDTTEKIVTIGSKTYIDANEYGKPDDYTFNMTEDSLFTEGNDSLWGSATLKNSNVENVENLKTLTFDNSTAKDITCVSKVNINKGVNRIEDFIGDSSTSQLTIAKNTILILDSIDIGIDKNGNNLAANTKVILNGTLVLNSSNINAGTIISGKGEIATIRDNFTDLKANVNYLHLIDTGATSLGFSGTTAEQADNYINKAAKWDGEDEYVDWLGYWFGYKEGFDKVDYITFKAEAGDTLNLEVTSGDFSDFQCTLVDKQGNETIIGNGYTLATSDDYILKIEHLNATDKTSTSLSYSVSLD